MTATVHPIRSETPIYDSLRVHSGGRSISRREVEQILARPKWDYTEALRSITGEVQPRPEQQPKVSVPVKRRR